MKAELMKEKTIKAELMKDEEFITFSEDEGVITIEPLLMDIL